MGNKARQPHRTSILGIVRLAQYVVHMHYHIEGSGYSSLHLCLAKHLYRLVPYAALCYIELGLRCGQWPQLLSLSY